MPKLDKEKAKELDAIRHSTSHIMADAVLEIFPEAKLAIGPSIENGFYYEFDLPHALTLEDLDEIEKRMKEIVKQNQKFEKSELTKDEARKLFKDQPYKIELIDDIADENVSTYKHGKFTDLCAGPHIDYTKRCKHFKLLNIAGAYWRGSEHNKMLQRIYGTVFPTKEELENHLRMIEEAKKRDHRKLGKELELFFFHPSSPGCPFWLPKGAFIFYKLIDIWRKVHTKAGYTEIKTPLMFNKALWEQSGHWEHYQDYMFLIPHKEQMYSLKPMDCPDAMITYLFKKHSYRDLPLRLNEIGLIHRNEKSGTLGGLMRVRQVTQDDAHIFVTEDQILDEITKVIEIVDYWYKIFNLEYDVYLSTRPQDAMGEKALWDKAELDLESSIKANKLDFTVNPGDGAFYGPKIDFIIRDSLGREWQCATIQLDFQLPRRFNLTYTDKDNTEKIPVVIHRVIYGSFERFIGILIEHYGGAFPVWLAPIQVRIMSVGENHISYAQKIYKEMFDKEIRVELDTRSETVNFKIREAELQKISYMLVVGDKEIQNETVAVRSYKSKKLDTRPYKQFIEDLLREAEVFSY